LRRPETCGAKIVVNQAEHSVRAVVGDFARPFTASFSTGIYLRTRIGITRRTTTFSVEEFSGYQLYATATNLIVFLQIGALSSIHLQISSTLNFSKWLITSALAIDNRLGKVLYMRFKND
jgi:hypothetical protein